MEIKKLPVKLKAKELEGRAQELARTVSALEGVGEAKKDATASFREQEKALRKRLKELSQTVTSGEEMREIECWDRADPDHGVFETVRGDTKEVIGSRTMTADEIAQARQGKLFEDAPGGKRKRAKKRGKLTAVEGGQE